MFQLQKKKFSGSVKPTEVNSWQGLSICSNVIKLELVNDALERNLLMFMLMTFDLGKGKVSRKDHMTNSHFITLIIDHK